MAKRRIGALISIEKETGLSEYIETGTRHGFDDYIGTAYQYFHPKYTAS